MSTDQSTIEPCAAPFPYFGGKSRCISLTWPRFGAVHNYVEPFAGSAAMLLGRPEPFEGTETLNDADGMVANFWRAIEHDPEGVCDAADNPVNEADLHARHAWLHRQAERRSRLLKAANRVGKEVTSILDLETLICAKGAMNGDQDRIAVKFLKEIKKQLGWN